MRAFFLASERINSNEIARATPSAAPLCLGCRQSCLTILEDDNSTGLCLGCRSGEWAMEASIQ